MSVNFLYSVKIHWCCLHIAWIFLSMHDFITLVIAHLEYIGALSYTDLPNVDAFPYII